MKKAVIALVAMGVVSGVAMAESSVTLYGVADVALGQAKAIGDKKFGAQSNSIVTNAVSRIGFMGKEDLGGGLWAGFKYEGAVSLGTGAMNANAWSREANLQLGSPAWGTVKLGRSLTPSFYGAAAWELTGMANYSLVANVYGWGASPYPRTNAQLDYKTPIVAKVLSAEIAYVPQAQGGALFEGNGLGVANQSDRWDVNVIYNDGSLALGLNANKARKTSPAAPGNSPTNYGDKLNYSVGGSYKFGKNFILAASYNRSNYNQAWLGVNPQSRILGARYGYTLGGSFLMGPVTLTIDLSRDTKNETYANRKKYTNGLVEAKYALSKRTFLYADYFRLDSYNNYGLGIRHNF